MRLWRNNPQTPGGKYLVKRRDDTHPEWPYFVIGGADPCAPVALRAYADEAERQNFDPEYVSDIRALAKEMEEWFKNHPAGDPDAPRHRRDDPVVCEILKHLKGA